MPARKDSPLVNYNPEHGAYEPIATVRPGVVVLRNPGYAALAGYHEAVSKAANTLSDPR